jgi:hypothetical protein
VAYYAELEFPPRYHQNLVNEDSFHDPNFHRTARRACYAFCVRFRTRAGRVSLAPRLVSFLLFDGAGRVQHSRTGQRFHIWPSGSVG